MESHGVFGRGARRGNGGNRGGGGRKVNFKNEHDDRFGNEEASGSFDQHHKGGYNKGRGGANGGQWTRRPRGNRGGHYGRGRDNQSYGGNDYGGENKRYQPYNTRGNFQKGRGDTRGGKKGNVFTRLGLSSGRQDEKKRGGVFDRLSLRNDDSKDSETWHKIMIVGGAEGNHDEIITELQGQIQEPFQAQQVHSKGDKLMFFISEYRAAMELKQLKDSSVVVKPSGPPLFGPRDRQKNDGGGEGSWERGSGGGFGTGPRDKGNWKSSKVGSLQRADSDVMEEDSTEVLLSVLGERFDTMNMSIDLSDMFHDRTLQQHNIRGSMFDGNFVNSILELVAAHCPNLIAIDLSKNQLRRLDLYSKLKETFPKLQILDLSDNQLNHANCLEALGQMPSITNLVLENNPFQQFHQDFASYAGNIRKYFPNLQVLDGQQLPSPVKFDLPSSSGSLPASQKGYLVNEEVRKLVVSFLEQYYTIYDDESRDKLLEAYSDNAVFSMCVNLPPQQLRNNPYPPSRNLVRVNETGKRSSLIKRGRIDIVQLLRNLPRSYHLSSTFNVDVMRASPVSTAFTVHGVFSEAATAPKSDLFPIRAFSRTFMIVAAGNGVAIVNDQLSIRTASHQVIQQHHDDVKQHFSPPATASFSSIMGTSSSSLSSPPFGVPAPSQSITQPSLPTTAQVNPTGFSNPQEDSITRLSADTRMNLEWSRKCLAENNWDYNSALAAFNHLNGQGSIPSEAFAGMM